MNMRMTTNETNFNQFLRQNFNNIYNGNEQIFNKSTSNFFKNKIGFNNDFNINNSSNYIQTDNNNYNNNLNLNNSNTSYQSNLRRTNSESNLGCNLEIDIFDSLLLMICNTPYINNYFHSDEFYKLLNTRINYDLSLTQILLSIIRNNYIKKNFEKILEIY